DQPGDRSPVPGTRGRHRGQLDHHYAPSRLWPQTRTTLPVTPSDPGDANHATVSATSAGRPPWDRLLMRRPASRRNSGILPVIAVSMKPGATALIVMPRAARSRASAWTTPITPAFEVA